MKITISQLKEIIREATKTVEKDHLSAFMHSWNQWFGSRLRKSLRKGRWPAVMHDDAYSGFESLSNSVRAYVIATGDKSWKSDIVKLLKTAQSLKDNGLAADRRRFASEIDDLFEQIRRTLLMKITIGQLKQVIKEATVKSSEQAAKFSVANRSKDDWQKFSNNSARTLARIVDDLKRVAVTDDVDALEVSSLLSSGLRRATASVLLLDGWETTERSLRKFAGEVRRAFEQSTRIKNRSRAPGVATSLDMLRNLDADAVRFLRSLYRDNSYTPDPRDD